MAQAQGSPIATPLADRHQALGARMVEFAGWLMPLQYAGIIEEHRAVRTRAGIFDLSHMGELYVDGADVAAALGYALVTDPASLKVGRAHYSMICFPEGGVLDDLIVYRLAEERFMVVANASNAAAVSDALIERFAGFKVVLDDRSLATALVAIQGPASLQVLAPLTDVAITDMHYYAIEEGAVAGVPALVARTGYTGEDGFEVFVDVAAAGRVWEPATPSALRQGCHSTATSWVLTPRRTRRAWAGWSSLARKATSSAGRPSRGPRRTARARSWWAWPFGVAESPATGTSSSQAVVGPAR